LPVKEEDVKNILEYLTDDAMKRTPPAYGQIGTIKAMVDLGNDWHSYHEVQRGLNKYLRTGNVFSFQLARHYPQLFEVELPEKVRIRPEAFSILKKLINTYANRILEAKSHSKGRMSSKNPSRMSRQLTARQMSRRFNKARITKN
jgi:hypothetical protein